MEINKIGFPAPLELPGEAALRQEVRAFLVDQAFEPRCDAWLTSFDP